MPAPPRVLTIAGSDPSGGAGLQADLRVFAAHGLVGVGVVTALTVQSARDGVTRVEPVEPGLLREQLLAALADGPIAAAKTGMLGSARNAAVVADLWAGPAAGIPLVVDPVVRSSSGADLLGVDGLAVLRDRLLPLAALVTPNAMEAAALGPTERRCPTLRTGGHDGGDEVVDRLLRADGSMLEIRHPRIATEADHGTGCLVSAAIAAALAVGADLDCAVRHGVSCAEQGLRAAAYGSVLLLPIEVRTPPRGSGG